tara:strand:+ start:247 stop:603 length:357 start_codon:yes stop_codon:yes gene_type:complete
MNKKDLIILKKLESLLKKSKDNHNKYLQEESKFLYAKKIRNSNQNILKFIENKFLLFPAAINQELLDLKTHLIEWSERWDAHKLLIKPSDNDIFIFKGYKTYPRSLDSCLYELIKKQL